MDKCKECIDGCIRGRWSCAEISDLDLLDIHEWDEENNYDSEDDLVFPSFSRFGG